MHENDLKLLEETFKKYYFDHFDLIHVPHRPAEREFGYQKFNSGMIRHLTIKNDKELHLMLMNNVPSDVYCSNAYYSFPNLPMEEKDWKEANLIFDIDAKDLNLDCRNDHICKKCRSCQEVFVNLSECPNCQSKKLDQRSLTCKNCIHAVKQEVKKLFNILIDDLGIEQNNIQVFFSGNEGFHIYALNTQYEKLGSRERADLVDYLMLRGIIPETFGFKKFKPERSSFPDLDEKGWGGRVAKYLFGSKSKRSKLITKILADGYSSFQKQLEDVKEVVGIKIDPNVTIDVHRIFRLPGSLNSKSGLTKQKCENVDKFDPFSDACFIDDKPTEVLANCPSSFELKNIKFGPFKNEKVLIPKFAAIYMICKGLATSTW